MSHFLTLAYLRAFAPWLVLLACALVGILRRVWLLIVIALAACSLQAGPEELFSRQLAADLLSRVALIGIAASLWRARDRREVLAGFALALVAAGNDLLVVSGATVLASVAAHRPRAWPLLAAAGAFAWSSETELALIGQRSPMAAALFAATCVLALPWRLPSLIAALALCARLAVLAWAGPAQTWILR